MSDITRETPPRKENGSKEHSKEHSKENGSKEKGKENKEKGKEKKTFPTLKEFMNAHRVAKGSNVKPTHTGMRGQWMGAYHIPSSDLDTFFETYEHHIFIEEKDGVRLKTKRFLPNLTESYRDLEPVTHVILSDIDLRYTVPEGYEDADLPKQYTIEQRNSIVQIYCEEVERCFSKTIPEDKRICFVFERSAPYVDLEKDTHPLKDGFHLMFPYISTPPVIQLALRQRIMKTFKERGVELGTINSIEDIFDESVINRNNWMMYGSCKLGKEPYRLTDVVRYDSQSLVQEKDVLNYYSKKQRELVRLLSLRTPPPTASISDDGSIYTDIARFGHVDENIGSTLKPSASSSRLSSSISTSPSNTSSNVSSNITNMSSSFTSSSSSVTSRNETARSESAYSSNSDTDMTTFIGERWEEDDEENNPYDVVLREDYETMVSILSDERASNEQTWMDVGRCLFHISEDYLDIWDTFSQRSENYDAEVCRRRWVAMHFRTEPNVASSVASKYEIDPRKSSLPSPITRWINETVHHYHPEVTLRDAAHERNKGFHLLTYDKPTTPCALCQRVHSGNHFYVIYNEQNQEARYHCHDTDAQHKFIALGVFGQYQAQQRDTEEMSGIYQPVPLFTLRDLRKWIQQDNPRAYSAFDTQRVVRQFQEAICGSDDSNLSLALHLLVGRKYVRVHEKNKPTWYRFNGLRWVKDHGGEWLERDIRGRCKRESVRVRSILQQQIQRIPADTEDEDLIAQRDELKSKYANVSSHIKTIDKQAGKRSIMCDCAYLFTKDASFGETLDTNPKLIGFKNGIVDLNIRDTNGRPGVFRYGRSDDYVTLSTGYDYINVSTDPNINPYIKEIRDFLHALLPDSEVVEYLLRFLGSCLDGVHRYELIHIFLGKAAQNGKSTLTDLIEQTFGGYSASVQPGLLTKHRPNSAQAQPDLFATRKTRICTCGEPESRDKFTNNMKKMTGGDLVRGRSLFSPDELTWRPMSKWAMSCNRIPAPENSDNGFYRRIRIISFDVEFVDPLVDGEPDPNDIYKRKADSTVHDRIPLWRVHLMNMLLKDYYPQFLKIGLAPPPKVLSSTLQYRRDIDLLSEFKEDCIEITPRILDLGERISFKEIVRTFREWFSDAYQDTGDKPPAIKEIRDGLERVFGNKLEEVSGKKCWRNVRLNTQTV